MTLRRIEFLKRGAGRSSLPMFTRRWRLAWARSAFWSVCNRPPTRTSWQALAKQLAMHVAAAKPEALTIADVDPTSLLDREREVLKEQALASGKKPEFIDKMVEGRVRKYYEEVVLMEQLFVMDGETKIAKRSSKPRSRIWARRSPLPASSASAWARASKKSRATLPPKSLQRWQE